ncbi:hypothetical protein KR222_008497 [Zaprionus bogoriensis]|nr:hypothetical protein KR222_008497 [Zaprionus bogoriensis]
MLKHASNTSSATAVAPVAAQLLRTANGGSSSSNNNNNSSSNNNINSNNNNNNNSNSSSNSNCNNNNNTPLASAATAATTTNTGAGAAAGTGTGPSTAVAAGSGACPAIAAGASPTPAAAAVASTARNIHLRPPQPLNISALNASTCSSTLLNGRLLNIATPPMKPLTPLTPNGHCSASGNGNGNGSSLHHHTYTNQHMLASSSSSSANQQQQQQQQQQHLHSQQQLQLPPQHHLPSSNHNNNNNNNVLNYSQCNNVALNGNSMLHASVKPSKHGPGPREVLTSLGLLCLVSLLLALLSLIFLLKISPNSREDALTRSISSEDFIIVYDVTLALCALSLSLNLCCLLVCAIQFLFAVKLLRSPMFDGRDNKYLEKSSASRTCAVSGFFISIPVFLTGIILYTFNHFHSTPAIITSVLIGVGIVFCGGAMVHNVFVWQKEKTISYRSPAMPLPLPLHMTSLPLPLPLPLPPVPLSPASQYLGQQTPLNLGQQPAAMSLPLQQHHTMLSHHPTSVTPVSPNHSHGSFNPLLNGNVVNSPFLVRPATATPPTPKPISIVGNGSCLVGREASGSVSPGIPPTLDMSNITISLHELSTLV